MLDSTTISYVIIRSLPESILLMLAGFILLNLKIDKIKILKVGLIFGIIVTGIRSLPTAYGIHTVLSMMMLGFVLIKITEVPLAQGIMATCGIFISLALSEGIYVGITTGLLGMDIDMLVKPDIQGAIMSLPSLAIFIGIVMIMKSVFDKIKTKSEFYE